MKKIHNFPQVSGPIIALCCLLCLLTSCNVSDLNLANADGIDVNYPMTKADDSKSSFEAFNSYWASRDSIIEAAKQKESGIEKLMMCQIDGNDLKEMSTEDLAKACYTFPMAFDILSFDDLDSGADFFIKHFNGLAELSTREDAPKAMLNVYGSSYDSKTGINDILYERVMLNPAFSKSFSSEETAALGNAIKSKKSQRQQSAFPKTKSGNITQPASLTSSYEVRYTPFGKSFYCEIPETANFTEAELEEAIDYYGEWYPTAIMIAPPSRNYNCHAYAWLWSQSLIMSPSSVYLFYTDDLYQSCAISKAQKVIYYDYQGEPCHSASVYNSTYYTSKWGTNGPLMRHTPDCVPASYMGNGRGYFADLTHISGPDFYEVNDICTYTVTPYMSYANYSWEIDQREERYQIISQNGNELKVKFLASGIIYDVYCNILNENNNFVKTLMYETVYDY